MYAVIFRLVPDGTISEGTVVVGTLEDGDCCCALDAAGGDCAWAAIKGTAMSWTMKSATTESARATRDVFISSLGVASFSAPVLSGIHLPTAFSGMRQRAWSPRPRGFDDWCRKGELNPQGARYRRVLTRFRQVPRLPYLQCLQSDRKPRK